MVITRTSALSSPMLAADEERALIADYKQTKSPAALDRITKSYYRLCYSTAARYADNEAAIEDLAQEGSIGIEHGILKYDPSRGTKFSTYVRRWVQSAIASAAARTLSDISIPARLYMDAKMNRVSDHNEAAKNAVLPTTSLDAPLLHDDESGSVGSRLADGSPTPEDVAISLSIQQEAIRQVAVAIACLNEREALIVTRRRLTEYPETLEEIAYDLRITRERVRQIEMQAMQKMRDTLMAAGCNGDLFAD